MDKIVLLSPQLREKVEAKVAYCLKKAEATWGKKFKMPEIRYDIKNSNSGMAYHQLWLIRFNLILLIEHEEQFINTTVVHEVAHLIVPKVYRARGKKLQPHGPEWVEVMRILGAPAQRTHSYLRRHHGRLSNR